MNESSFYYSILRHVYYYRGLSSSVLRSRTYTLAKSFRLVTKEPYLFVKKAGFLAVHNPRKLVDIALGRRTIQNMGEHQQKLALEYRAWIKNMEQSAFNAATERKQTRAFKQRPLVSLITPVFNPPVDAHDKLVRSVIEQTYENFELLLFNFGDKPDVRKLLDDWAAKDKRVIVKHDLTNKGISANSDLCLKYVKGEFVGLLDHDDALMPNALFECIKVINEQEVDFIYSDKDKISEADERSEPLFKPDWSPEMALGGNYMTHFNLMRTSLVKGVGGWDPRTDGAQDWDLFWRILDITDKVVHVPKILYHWRTVEGSTANAITAKPYALQAQRLAVDKHLQRHGLAAESVHDETGQMYVRWQDRKVARLFIIHGLYGDWGNAEKLAQHLCSEPDYHPDSVVVLMCLAGSITDKIQEEYAGLFERVKLVEYESGEFAQALRSVAADADCEMAVYLTDSTRKLGSGMSGVNWMSQLTGWLGIPEVDMAGGAAYAEDGRLVDMGSFYCPVHAAFQKYYFSSGLRSGYAGYVQWIRNFVLVSERINAFRVSLLQERNFAALQDIRDDEVLTALALTSFARSHRSVYDPLVSSVDGAPFYLVLRQSPTIAKFMEKYCPILQVKDPYYNPNLGHSFHDPRPLGANEDVRLASAYGLRSVEMPSID